MMLGCTQVILGRSLRDRMAHALQRHRATVRWISTMVMHF
jgi:hypothetical protein